jgi:hypothetical protein
MLQLAFQRQYQLFPVKTPRHLLSEEENKLHVSLRPKGEYRQQPSYVFLSQEYAGSLQSMTIVKYLENGFSEILEILHGVKSI